MRPLINPPMMPMLLAFVVIAAELGQARQPTRPLMTQTLTSAGLTALAWFGGYALAWATNWLLAIRFAADPAKTQAIIVKQILLRLYGWEPNSPMLIFPLVPTLTMIAQSFISAGSALVAILAAALFIHVQQRWAEFDCKRFLLLISPMVVLTLWFELLNNHTKTHSHFTYRSESAAIAIFLAAVVMATRASRHSGRYSQLYGAECGLVGQPELL